MIYNEKINKKIIGKILDDCQSCPFVEKRFIVDGFDFHVYWDNNFFEGGMFFNPSWSHSNAFSCKTKDEFFMWMERLIMDAKKIYLNGGKYPDNYYDNEDEEMVYPEDVVVSSTRFMKE